MVAPGGVWFCSGGGGMRGFIWGGAWFYPGVCVVLFGGACMVFSVFSDTMRYGQ